jgi:hypothetical protein
MKCLIVQPIHPEGIVMLRAAGLELNRVLV